MVEVNPQLMREIKVTLTVRDVMGREKVYSHTFQPLKTWGFDPIFLTTGLTEGDSNGVSAEVTIRDAQE